MAKNSTLTTLRATWNGCLLQLLGTSDTTKQYLKEALKSYEQECFLASSVMLGGAAEDTTLDVAASFASWQGKSAEKLKKVLENPRQFYVYKLQEFEKRLTAVKRSIPPEFSEN